MTRAARFVPEKKPARRRVYMLPSDMIERLHRVGREIGATSEADIVRRLLDEALKAKGR